MPKQRRKTTKRSRSPSLAVSEHSEPSTESEAPIPTTNKEPEVVEVAEPTLTQDSTGDNPIPPSQPNPKKRQKNTSVILSDDEETWSCGVAGWPPFKIYIYIILTYLCKWRTEDGLQAAVQGILHRGVA